MSRAALRSGILLGVGWLAATAAAAIHPHLDTTRVSGGCRACHRGHGVSGSPMLPAPQAEACLSCHSTRAAADLMAAKGLLAPTAEPPLLTLDLSQPFVHPLDREAFSRHDPGKVTCTSCHSPHRRSARPLGEVAAGGRKLSTRDPTRFENELCADCHGSRGVTTESLFDLSRLTNPNNRSFHPLEGPATERSTSVREELRDREINCTDCHGNSDPSGAGGLHGSGVRHLLRREYVTADGNPEGRESYGLCYECHDRDRVLEASPFPLHELHVVDQQVACATCHSAHGSVENRALIRFGEETHLANVGPSGSSGRLEFISPGPGSGSCFVGCHGIDHAPASYGATELLGAGSSLQALPQPPAAGQPPVRAPVRSPNRPRRRVPPPR